MQEEKFDVRYVANLARLELTDDEASRFQGQLAHVLEYVQRLQQVDISGVEPTAHTFPMVNVFRQDAAAPGFSPEAALANAPRTANHLLMVPKVL